MGSIRDPRQFADDDEEIARFVLERQRKRKLPPGELAILALIGFAALVVISMLAVVAIWLMEPTLV